MLKNWHGHLTGLCSGGNGGHSTKKKTKKQKAIERVNSLPVLCDKNVQKAYGAKQKQINKLANAKFWGLKSVS